MHDLAILAIIWTSVFIAVFLTDKTSLTPLLWYLFCGSVLVEFNISVPLTIRWWKAKFFPNIKE